MPTLTRSLLSLIALALALSGCAAMAAGNPSASAPADRPRVGGWLVADPAALVAALPPAPAQWSADPPIADPAAERFWSEPASAWMHIGLQGIRSDGPIPPQATRTLMLLGVAIHDALLAGELARGAGVPASDHALIAAAASGVLRVEQPIHVRRLIEAAEAGAWAGYQRGADSPAAVLQGQRLGAAVADVVLAWAARDGSQQLPLQVAPPPADPGTWAPTPPKGAGPQAPGWGTVRTVAIGDPAALLAPPPPPWGSPAMEGQIATFRSIQAGLSPEQLALARRWAGGSGTATPAGLWAEIALAQIAARATPTREAAAIYAALGVALHDSAVACWATKYRYWLVRPITVLQRSDPAWSPALATPPHPSYPSGHACFSGAAAAVLGAAFPGSAAELDALAEQAAASRVYGGIHWPIDGEAGLALGRQVAAAVLASPHAPGAAVSSREP